MIPDRKLSSAELFKLGKLMNSGHILAWYSNRIEASRIAQPIVQQHRNASWMGVF